MIKAIIFDCFGVVFSDQFPETYRKFGGDLEMDRDFIAGVYRDSHMGVIPSSSTVFAKHLGVNESDWLQALTSSGSFDFDLLKYIDTLREKYKVGLLSNVSKTGLSKHMDVSVLESYFDVLVLSSEIGFAKPDREAYEITAQRLDVSPSECVFVDDAKVNCDGAKAAGMTAIWYQDFAKLEHELGYLVKSLKS